MIPYVGCDYARERLEGLLDNELSVDEQVLVESHVRWCRTCADRIEDFQLIGTSIRNGPPTGQQVREVEPALSAVYSRVLMRMRAERDQAFARITDQGRLAPPSLAPYTGHLETMVVYRIRIAEKTGRFEHDDVLRAAHAGSR